MKHFLSLLCILAPFIAACGDDPAGPGEDANLPPTVEAPESVKATVGVPVMFAVVATDPDGEETSVDVLVLVTSPPGR